MTFKLKKPVLKWIKRLTTGGFALLLFLSILLSIPQVQTFLGQLATSKINDNFGTDITIGQITANFKGEVVLKNIMIKDHRRDTLIAASRLNTSVLNVRRMMDGDLNFGAINLDGLHFILRTYRGELQTNLDYFVEQLEASPKPGRKPSPFLMKAKTVHIKDAQFAIIDDNKNSHLDFEKLSIDATKFLIDGPNVSMAIDHLGFLHNSGLEIENLSADFTYTLSAMDFNDLQITTPASNIKGQLGFAYQREDLKFFNDRVHIHASFDTIDLSTNDLGLFYQGFGDNINFRGSTELSGTLNQLKVTDLTLNFDQNATLSGDIELLDLFNGDSGLGIDGKIDQLKVNRYNVSNLFPSLLSSNARIVLDNLGSFDISGDFEVSQSAIDANMDVRTDLGALNPKMTYAIEQNTLTGVFQLSQFHLGKLLDLNGLGLVSGQAKFALANLDRKDISVEVEGDLEELTFRDYRYRDTSFNGTLVSDAFEGQFRFRDESLNANFDGSVSGLTLQKQFNFAAHILEADLKAMNLASTEKEALFSGHLLIQAEGANIDDALGIASFYDITYRNQDGNYTFENFDITATLEEKNRLIKVNSPEIISGQISGQFKLTELKQLARNSLTHIYNLGDKYEVSPNQSVDFDFTVYNKIAKIFSTYLNIGNNGRLYGHMESNSEKFKVNVTAPYLATRDVLIENMFLELDNRNPVYNTFLEIGAVSTPFIKARDFNLINLTREDTLLIKTNFKGAEGSLDQFDLNLYYATNEQNKSVLGFRRSNIIYQNVPWVLNPERDTNHKMEFDKSFEDILVYPSLLVHENEEIQMSGALFSAQDEALDLKFKDVNLEHILPVIDKFKMSGIVNGQLSLRQQESQLKPTADISINNYVLNDFAIGDFDAKISGKTSAEYDVKAKLSNAFIETISIEGGLNFEENAQNINLLLQLNGALLDPLTPVGGDIITDIRGEASGVVLISGSFDEPQYEGQLVLDNAGIAVPYLNVDYNFEGDTKIQLEGQSFELNNLDLVDSAFETRATMGGSIRHSNYKNWILDLDITSPRMLVLNTNNDKKPLYYGTAFVGGNIGIKGQAEALVINAEVLTQKGTTFVIPLNETEVLSNSDYLTFITPEEKYNTLGIERWNNNAFRGLELDFDLEIDENADIEIILDPLTKSGIRGSGNGGLLVQINTNGKFNMYGDFIVSKGVYNYIYEPIIRKEFKVRPGGTLVWNGEPTKAEINVTAVYSQLQANPSILLDNPINRSIPVEVEIQLSGELERPEPNFDLRFPSVNSALNSELSYRLNDSESKQFQALSLLATGAFTNQLRLDEQAVYGNLVERLSAIVNSAISGGNDAIQLGLDYQLGRKTQEYITENRVGLSLSGKISDRVLFNGKVGVPFGGVNETVVAGDFEIQILLNEERTLTLNVFNKENDIQNFGEAIFFTQGVGLSYDVEFDNLKDLLQKIFQPKKTNSKELKNESKEQNAAPLKGFMSFKKQ